MSHPPIPDLSRRDLLRLIGSVGAATAFGITEASRAAATPRAAGTVLRTGGLVSRAAATRAHGSDLGAVEHVVFLMMENRSYDHYFGAYPKGRGFDDHPKHSLGAFEQRYPSGGSLHPKNRLLPFELTAAHEEFCTDDLTHDWGPMHECWNHGKMDHFVKVHTSSEHEGAVDGAMTMGYYTRKQLGFYWSVADHFTLCDNYHSSILGPTHPNRLMANTGWIDPAGTHGGPVTDTNPDPAVRWSCSWTTVQEVLEDAHIPWKVYHPSYADLPKKYAHLAAYETWNPVLYDPTANPLVMLASDHVLPYFKAFESPTSALYQKAFTPTFPNDFVSDIAGGKLPKVSWIIPPLGFDEHPSSSPQRGMYFTQLVLDALMADKATWSKTVLFLMYDENDGWFDHVRPPTAPHGTPGEWLTAGSISSATNGIRGPLGLGVRVPMLVMSPFARGGHVVSEIFDHTSQLKFLHERFGIEIPNVSRWRRRTVGDLTDTLFTSHKHMSMPHLPTVPLAAPTTMGTCSEQNQDSETGGAAPSVPKHQRMPTQHGTTKAVPTKRRHTQTGTAASHGARTQLRGEPGRRTGPRSSTRKADAGDLATLSTKGG